MAHNQVDTLKLSDGSTMNLARLANIDDATWGEVKSYLESNPEMAKCLKNISKDPDAIRSWLQTQAIAQHYASKQGDNQLQETMKALQSDPEFAPFFEQVKTDGIMTTMKACQDEELMVKLSQKMGGLPPALLSVLKKLHGTSMTLHEACKNGDIDSVKQHVANKQLVNDKDNRGITPLGYALGANRGPVVQLLLESHANPHSVDNSGNSGLHYASGYGRMELVEFLLKAKANVSQANAQGQTPLVVATMNKHASTIQILQQYGAKA